MTPRDKINKVIRKDSKDKTEIFTRDGSSFRINDINPNDYNDLIEDNEKLKKQVANMS